MNKLSNEITTSTSFLVFYFNRDLKMFFLTKWSDIAKSELPYLANKNRGGFCAMGDILPSLAQAIESSESFTECYIPSKTSILLDKPKPNHSLHKILNEIEAWR